MRAAARFRGGAVTAAVGAAVYAAARADGAYDVSAWAPLGAVLTATVAGLLVVGWRPTRACVAAAVALVGFGLWSVASTAWGGLPDEAWHQLDVALIGAAAVMAGSMLAPVGRHVVDGVLAGVAALGVEVLVRSLTGGVPHAWLHTRAFDGPVGHHTAEGMLFAATAALAVGRASSGRAPVRAAAMGVAGLSVGCALMTQSRAVVPAFVVAAVVQAVWARTVTATVRLATLLPAALALVPALRVLDRAAAVDALPTDHALRAFAGVTVAVAVATAASGLVPVPARVRRSTCVVALAVVAAVGAATAAAWAPRTLPSLSVEALRGDPKTLPPGSTRFASIGLNGRNDAWRVGAAMIGRSPLIGAGQGRFAVEWTRTRRLFDLYVLQPHSLEVEFLAELGAIGFGLFGASAVLLFGAVVRARRRPAAAAAGAALVVVAVHASVDWVWWLPGVTAPFLLAAAATAGDGTPAVRTTRRATGAALAVSVVVLAAFALPFLSDMHVARAEARLVAAPDAAAHELAVGHALDPWSPDVESELGRLDESTGQFLAAARHYRRAATLSQRPWLLDYRVARALRRGGFRRARGAACARAQALNPLEPALRRGPCS